MNREEQYAARLREVRDWQKKSIDNFEQGHDRVFHDYGTGEVDVTQERLETLRRHVAELDALLADRPSKT